MSVNVYVSMSIFVSSAFTLAFCLTVVCFTLFWFVCVHAFFISFYYYFLDAGLREEKARGEGEGGKGEVWIWLGGEAEYLGGVGGRRNYNHNILYKFQFLI